MNETIIVDGYKFTVTNEYDHDTRAPWDEHDGHGPVSDCTSRAKKPGERVLHEDRSFKRYYDWETAVFLAKRDGWGAPGDEGMTRGQKAAHAAEADFQRLKDWCDDKWTWVVLTVTLFDPEEDDTTEYSQSCGGIESDSDHVYFTEVAEDLARQVLASVPMHVLRKLACDTAERALA